MRFLYDNTLTYLSLQLTILTKWSATSRTRKHLSRMYTYKEAHLFSSFKFLSYSFEPQRGKIANIELWQWRTEINKTSWKTLLQTVQSIYRHRNKTVSSSWLGCTIFDLWAFPVQRAHEEAMWSCAACRALQKWWFYCKHKAIVALVTCWNVIQSSSLLYR